MANVRSTKVIKQGQQKTFKLKSFVGFPAVVFRANGFSAGKPMHDVASQFDTSISSSKAKHDGTGRVRPRKS
jgi:hypothetical protein